MQPFNIQAPSIARAFCRNMRELYPEHELARYRCPRCASELVTVRPSDGGAVVRKSPCVACGAPLARSVSACGRVETLAV